MFTDIYDIYNIDFAPIILKNVYNKEKDLKIILSNWFKGRGIPLWRDDLDLLLSKLNISAPAELLDKACGLSLSDQYWIKPYDSKIEYKDINFTGSIEAMDIPKGDADVIVCEAFVGNVILKLYEGLAGTLLSKVMQGLMSTLRCKIGA